MSIYNQIFKQFQEKFNYTQFQKFELEQLSKNLDYLARTNCNAQEFDSIIKEEIIDIVPVTYDKKIILKDFVATIQKIFDILCKYIAQTQKNLERLTDPEQISVQKQNIWQFTGDREYLCNVFRLPIKSQSKILTKLRDQEESQYQQSQALYAAFIILVTSIALQGVLMLSRFTFLNCFVYFLALAVFILNFFDRSYIRICILAFLISIIFDLLWCLKNQNFYSQSTQSDFSLKFGHLTQLKVILLRFTYITTIILMGAKLMLVWIFLRFRNNSIYTKKMVKFMNLKFYLQSKPYISPISRLVMKNHSHQETYCF